MPRLRLKAKLLLGSLLIVTVPLLIAAFVLPELISEQMAIKGRAELRHSADTLVTLVEHEFNHALSTLQGQARNRLYQSLLSAPASPRSLALEQAQNGQKIAELISQLPPAFHSLFLLDENGAVQVRSDRNGLPPTLPEELSPAHPFLAQLAKGAGPCFGEVHLPPGESAPGILLACPILSPRGQRLGHLVALCSLNSLCRIIADSNLGNGSYGFAIDHRGLIIAHPDPKRVLQLNFSQVKGAEELSHAMREGKKGVLPYVSSVGIRKVAAFAPVPGSGWSVAMSINQSDFFATAHQVRTWILWLTLTCALLISAASLYIARAFAQKQAALQSQAELHAQLLHTQRVEALGQLSGGVAHDFNNILGALQLQLSFLASEEKLSDKGRRLMEECMLTIDSGSALTSQLLLFSRKKVMQRTELDLRSLVGDLSKMLQRLIGGHHRLEVLLPHQPLQVSADLGMLQQVLLNLVLNARDAMPTGGCIRVLAEARGEHQVALSVSDEGTGIPPEVKARLFEPFFTTKEAGKGTGLGLSTTHRIVREHKGSITVTSELGKGSCFTVLLPLAAAAAPAPKPAPLPEPKPAPAPQLQTQTLPEARTAACLSPGPDAAEPPPDAKPAESPASMAGQALTILYVEDNEQIQDSITRFMERQGHRLLCANCVEQALVQWDERKEEIQLLITDIVMPGKLLGTDLALQVRKERPKLPILITSGFNADPLMPDPAVQGFHYLNKPFSPSELLGKVETLLVEHRG